MPRWLCAPQRLWHGHCMSLVCHMRDHVCHDYSHEGPCPSHAGNVDIINPFLPRLSRWKQERKKERKKTSKGGISFILSLGRGVRRVRVHVFVCWLFYSQPLPCSLEMNPCPRLHCPVPYCTLWNKGFALSLNFRFYNDFYNFSHVLLGLQTSAFPLCSEEKHLLWVANDNVKCRRQLSQYCFFSECIKQEVLCSVCEETWYLTIKYNLWCRPTWGWSKPALRTFYRLNHIS